MPTVRFPVSVTMERVPLVNRWTSERWQAACVELFDDAEHIPRRIADDAGYARWRFGGLAIEFYRAEAEGYYLNLASGNPKAFVMWRPAEDGDEPAARPLLVTLSYGEAARLLDAGEQVDPVPVPEPLLGALEAFVAAYYRPEPRKKAKRNELYERDARDASSNAEERNR